MDKKKKNLLNKQNQKEEGEEEENSPNLISLKNNKKSKYKFKVLPLTKVIGLIQIRPMICLTKKLKLPAEPNGKMIYL